MEQNEKIETLFRAALDATRTERNKSIDLSTGYQTFQNSWEIIVKHNGSLDTIRSKYPQIKIIDLLSNYGILELPEPFIDLIAKEESITYIEKPKRIFYEIFDGTQASCVTSLQTRLTELTGKGTIVGIIDSGIDYMHPDFIDQKQGSRILSLWDQTIPSGSVSGSKAPDDYPFGTLFTNKTLNLCLQEANPSIRQEICPSQDLSGHGTHVAGIAAGNGRASDNVYQGVAYEASLLVVKLGAPNENGFQNTAQLMTAIDFCVRESIKLKMPLALNLSFGNTYGSHSGDSLLESYIDSVCQLGKISIIIGNGNEGNSRGHTSGQLELNTPSITKLSIGEYTPTINIQLWKHYWDEFVVSITPPSGPSVTLPSSFGAWRFPLGDTELFSYNGEPTPYSPFQEIYLDLIPLKTYITPGIWSLQLIPKKIRNGSFHMWLPPAALRNQNTAFLEPTPNTTLTIPATARRAISVAAYDASQKTPAIFSGRGFTLNQHSIKPELAAPGVNITSCAPGGGYSTRSGTSMATPFVTGCASLFMQWGILEQNDPFLYGEKLKAYLINGTNTLSGIDVYPSPLIGWGTLCANQSLPK